MVRRRDMGVRSDDGRRPAVGDAAFQEKCLSRIREFRARGTTILLVSHQATEIAEYCDRALWLEQGELAALGETQKVLDLYGAALASQPTQSNS